MLYNVYDNNKIDAIDVVFVLIFGLRLLTKISLMRPFQLAQSLVSSVAWSFFSSFQGHG